MPGLPQLTVPHAELVRYVAEHPKASLVDTIKPYRDYEAQLRQIYAQDPDNEILNDPHLNVLPLFTEDGPPIQIRARNLEAESQEEKGRYIMPLPDTQRRPDESPAVVKNIKEFQHNFSVFSETSLVDLDWNNVVASGSSVVNCLLPVPEEYNTSKRALREFYHEKFCPASDVDLFLYDMNEKEAIEKIKDIETRIRDSILTETTTVRTKHAITICSQYPTRHVQIVLRIYKNVSEILTGFDIDCSGAAYDGKQVFCTPRALQSYMTQINHVDLTRRSPSYENRLSKYSHRGFEVYWPELDRNRIDPTIFERSFQRTLGLARLLILERLPTQLARDSYMAKRREERGRPSLNRRHFQRLAGNIKDNHEDEVADWVDEEEISNYHTFTIPYGEHFHAKKIEKLCYTRDLLLNAEWNQPKDREVYLHRHPAFFGRFDDVKNDCCGFCPKPKTEEEIEKHEEESKIYVSGGVSFLKDDPGRQQIGSFNPLTDDDWTEMAYVGNTARLMQAIVDHDVEHVEDWLAQEGVDPNTRDYTGRTALHLAATSSSPEVVKCLVDHGARLIARLADGRTALHLAAERGDVEIVKILMDKSVANEAEEEEKQEQRRKDKAPKADASESRLAAAKTQDGSEESDIDLMDTDDSDDSDNDQQSMATGSFIKVKNGNESKIVDGAVADDEDEEEPDFYDINVLAWDAPCSALHFAIISGNEDVVRLLCQEYGADILLPVKFLGNEHNPGTSALLTLALTISLPVEKAKTMAKTILGLGATSAQADMHGVTAFQRFVEENASALLDLLFEFDKTGTTTALNHITFAEHKVRWPLQSAFEKDDPRLILKLLDAGSITQIDFETWLKAAKQSMQGPLHSYEENKKLFERITKQPLILALKSSEPTLALELIKRGADVNVLTTASHERLQYTWRRDQGESALDIVRSQLKALRGYQGPEITVEVPRLKKGMDSYLSRFNEGTWQHAMVKDRICLLKKNHEEALEKYEKEKARIASLDGMKEKQAAIDAAIQNLEQLEAEILVKGGKTFLELHPDAKEPDQQHMSSLQSPPEGNDYYEYDFKFWGPNDITEQRKARYIDLFEAAWVGDLEKIKSLTLVSWKAGENHEPPLQIAVQHHMPRARDGEDRVNPFAIAYLRGHHDVARAILEIAQAQYVPKDAPNARYRMHRSDDSDDSDSDDDEQPRIYEEIVDENFTIEDIGKISMQVKSQFKPLDIMDWPTAMVNVKDGILTDMSYNEQHRLLFFVVERNDRQGLNFLLDLTEHFSNQNLDPEQDEATTFVPFPDWQFLAAVELGRTELLGDIIRRTGAGLPLEDLVKGTGVALVEKPRYYQGLTVYGKKRTDWANAGRQVMSRSSTGTRTSPLIHAAKAGCIESVEWFLSDAPLRYYLEFGQSKAAREDVRLKHLSQSPGGFEGAVKKWLENQNDLIIHAAIMGPNTHKTERLVEYLVKAFPSSLEAKSNDRRTPLNVACWLGRVNIVKILIDNGADQSTKDCHWNNLLHTAVECNPGAEQLQALLNLLDTEMLDRMFRDRCNIQHGDGRAPLHRWISKHVTPYAAYNLPDCNRSLAVLRLLLRYSKGRELDMFDAGGDTILHQLIRDQGDLCIVREILEFNPQLLYRENAVGITPAELAHNSFVASSVTPSPQWQWHNGCRLDKSVSTVLLARAPEEFVLGGAVSVGEDSRSRTQQIWDLVQEVSAATPGKRRLVSLNEANDVAKRIGDQYQSHRYGWNARQKRNEEAEAGEPEPWVADVVVAELHYLYHSVWKEYRD